MIVLDWSCINLQQIKDAKVIGGGAWCCSAPLLCDRRFQRPFARGWDLSKNFFDAKFRSRAGSYSSQWELLSRERRRCCASFKIFHVRFLTQHSMQCIFLCIHFPFGNSWLFFLHGTGGSIGQLYLSVYQPWFCPSLSTRNILSGLERAAQVTFKETNENLPHRTRTATQFSAGKFLWPLL